MKKILLSVSALAFVGAVVVGATGAFFSDTETSTGNTFTAGVIDLKIDNTSYYNSSTSPKTSWTTSDLTDQKFFNFSDVKPGDDGEDTISLHVNNNDSWLCADVALTSNDDNGITEPESEDGDVTDGPGNGELASHIQFMWWADDGDNVYEEGENSISGGIKTLTNLATSTLFSVALADSQNNFWTPSAPGPILGKFTQYIGKAWRFGTLTLAPVAFGQGVNPTIDPGVRCNGNSLNNLTQTDGATVDVAFRAIQARHNSQFLCKGKEPALATITVIKEVINNSGGNNHAPDFQLFVDNSTVSTPVTSNVATQVSAGSYTVGETGIPGYEASFSGDCNLSGEIILAPGDNKTCTITNDDNPPVSLLNDSFGTGASQNDIPNWEEKGEDSNKPHASSRCG